LMYSTILAAGALLSLKSSSNLSSDKLATTP
jgi:hypothetical protein